MLKKADQLQQMIDNIKVRMNNKAAVHDYVFLDVQEIAEFQEILSRCLIGEKMHSLYKRLGIFILCFGDSPQYVLHIECFFRVRLGKKLIMTCNDEYYASNWDELTPKELKKSQKNGYKNSLLEKNFQLLMSLTKNSTITSVEISEIGDLFLSFDNGVRIEIFVDNMGQNNEFYRFFKYQDDSSHYIVKHLQGKIILQK